MKTLKACIPLFFIFSASLFAQVGRPGEHGPFNPTANVTFDGAQAPPEFSGVRVYREQLSGNRIRWIMNFTTVTIPSGVQVRFVNLSDVFINATGAIQLHGLMEASGGNGSPGGNGSAGQGGPGGRGGNGGGGNGFGGQGGNSGRGCDGAGPRGQDGDGATSSGSPTFDDTDAAGIPCPSVAGGAAGGTGGTLGSRSDGTWIDSCLAYSIGKYHERPDPLAADDFNPFTIGPAGGGSGGGGGCAAVGVGGGGGGGGGAAGSALIIRSRRDITITGAIRVNGGDGGPGGSGGAGGGGGAGGAGGYIFVRGKTVNINGTLEANGARGGDGGAGTALSGAPGSGGGGGRIAVLASDPAGIRGINPSSGQNAQGQRGGQPTIFTQISHLECQSGMCRRIVGPGASTCNPEREGISCGPPLSDAQWKRDYIYGPGGLVATVERE